MTKSEFEPLLRDIIEERDGDPEDQIRGVMELLVEEGMLEEDEDEEIEIDDDRDY